MWHVFCCLYLVRHHDHSLCAASSISNYYFDKRHNDTIDFVHNTFRKDFTVVLNVLEAERSGLYLKQGTY